jgi:hypothetical protein
MDKRLQVQEKQALLAQNAGPENIAERVNQILEQGPLTQGLLEDLIDSFGDVFRPCILRQQRLLFLD